MNSLMEYKDYHAKIEYSSEDQTFVGRIIGINDVIGFCGDNIRELTDMFHEAVDDYLDDCKASGKEPDKEYKGSFNVRMTPESHRKAVIVAQNNNITLNQLVCDAVDKYCNTVCMH